MCGCVGVTRDHLLVNALADILCQAASANIVVCDIVHETMPSLLPVDASASSSVSDEPAVNSHAGLSLHNELLSLNSSQTAVKRCRLDHEQFHSCLRYDVVFYRSACSVSIS